PQERRLPAPGRPDEHDELSVRDVEVERVHGPDAVGVDLRDALELDPAAHAVSREACAGRSASGIASPWARVSSSQSSSIWSSVRVAEALGSSIAATRT